MSIDRFDVFDSKFRSLFIVSNEMFGFRKTEFKLIVSKVLNIKLFLYRLRVIFHVACIIISICKIKGLNIELKHTEQRRLFVLLISLLLKHKKITHFIFLCIDSKRREQYQKKALQLLFVILQEYMQ